jgi:hypothetical protein
MGKKFSSIQNFAAPGSQDCITGLRFSRKTMQIIFATIESKIGCRNRKADPLKITLELLPQ